MRSVPFIEYPDRVSRVLALLLATGMVVGCYTPAPPAGLPCSPGGDCPEGQMCGTDQVCHLDGEGADAGGGGTDDAGGDRSDGGPSCAMPGLPPELEGGTLSASPYDDGDTVEEDLTVNDDDWMVAALNKSGDPWGGPVHAGTFTFDLADSCAPASKTCITIDVIPPGGTSFDRTYTATSGLLRATIATEPNPPADPGNCAAHDGDVTGCDAQTGCGYYYCSATCRPDTAPNGDPITVSLCDAQCARGCGLTMELDDVVLSDSARPGCSTHVNVLTLTSPPM